MVPLRAPDDSCLEGLPLCRPLFEAIVFTLGRYIGSTTTGSGTTKSSLMSFFSLSMSDTTGSLRPNSIENFSFNHDFRFNFVSATVFSVLDNQSNVDQNIELILKEIPIEFPPFR